MPTPKKSDGGSESILHRLVRHLFGIDETLEELRSINKRIENLEKCVRPGASHKPHATHFATGHWND